jgi:hypothetical protein
LIWDFFHSRKCFTISSAVLQHRVIHFASLAAAALLQVMPARVESVVSLQLVDFYNVHFNGARTLQGALSRIGLSEKTASISQIALAASRKRDGKGNKSPAKMRIAATFSAGATFSGILVSVECDAEGPFRQKYLPIPVHRSARVECCVGTHSRGPRSQIIASNLLFRDDLRAQTSTCEVLASSSLCKLSKLCGAAKTDLRVYYPRVVAKNIDKFCLTEKN